MFRMMSQILKFVNFTKTQKSRYLNYKTLSFLTKKKNHSLQIKGYYMAKNTFVAEVTVKFY